MKSLWIAAALASSIGLTACSERTEANADAAATAAGEDIEAATADLGQAAEGVVSEADAALGTVGDSIEGAADEAGQEVEEAGPELQE